ANGVTPDNAGAGLNNLGSPRIERCVFVDNSNSSAAGATIFNHGTGTPVVANCVVLASSGGPSVDNQGGAVTFVNCTIANNNNTGLRFLNCTGASSVSNCVLWANAGQSQIPQNNQIALTNSVVSVSHTCIEGLQAPFVGSGNIGSDPIFLDPLGLDGVMRTADDNLRLRGDSPCIDAASSSLLLLDAGDVNDNGSTIETDPLDLDGALRRQDDPLTTNTGAGFSPHPDMGAYEYTRGRLILVDINATGAKTGVDWTNAYTDLQAAITEISDPKFFEPGEIWVADGTYLPAAAPSAAATFGLVHQVGIYGGFAGGERTKAARNPLAHPAILSGDFAGGAASDAAHVVTALASFIDSTAVLDGFVISGGVAANGTGGDVGKGGGLLAKNGAAPTIRNCRFLGNSGSLGRAVLADSGASPTLVNCEFSGNTGINATVSAQNATLTMINCTVSKQTSASSAASGVGAQGGATLLITNCGLYGNTGLGTNKQANQIISSGAGNVITINFSAVEGLDGTLGGSGNLNVTANPGVADPDGADNVAGTLDDDYTILPCSILIDQGSALALPADVNDLDEDGNTTETIPIDLAAAQRRIDAPQTDSGAGLAPLPDIGAREFVPAPLPSPDINGDGIVDGADLGALLAAWATSQPSADLNGDCFVDGADLGIMLAAWGA
ncbi:MAG: GC-type dockerin domain-anchored protein, partial [Phycisphaerales bacterium]